MKYPNIAPGLQVNFRGFRGDTAVFSVERFNNGTFGINGLVSVPLRYAPSGGRAAQRARNWARHKVLEALAA